MQWDGHGAAADNRYILEPPSHAPQGKVPKLSLDAALPSTAPPGHPFVMRPDAPSFQPTAPPAAPIPAARPPPGNPPKAAPPKGPPPKPPPPKAAPPKALATQGPPRVVTAKRKAAPAAADGDAAHDRDAASPEGRKSVFARLQRAGGLQETSTTGKKKRDADAEDATQHPAKRATRGQDAAAPQERPTKRVVATVAATRSQPRAVEPKGPSRLLATSLHHVTTADGPITNALHTSTRRPQPALVPDDAPAAKRAKPAESAHRGAPSLRDAKPLGSGRTAAGATAPHGDEQPKPPTFAAPKSRAELRKVCTGVVMCV